MTKWTMAHGLTSAQDEWTDRQTAEYDYLMMLAEESATRDAEACADYCEGNELDPATPEGKEAYADHLDGLADYRADRCCNECPTYY